MTCLAAGRFVLRPFEDADAAAFAASVRESAASIARWMDWARADYDEAAARQWFEHCREALATGSAHEFGIFDAATGDLVGGAGLNQINALHGVANLGYWVRASRRRQGAALAAARALAQHGFGALALTRVEIVVAVGNDASERVARAAGGVHECVARNRLRIGGHPVPAHVFSLVP
jgi:RimJ/RimL family protein N-acetyltransferase